MHLIGSKVNHRAAFRNSCLTFCICFDTSFEHNDDFFVNVLVWSMRLNAWPKYGLMHFKLKARVIFCHENVTALFALTTQLSTLVRVVDIVSSRTGCWGLALPAQKRKQEGEFSARSIALFYTSQTIPSYQTIPVKLVPAGAIE